MIDACVCYNKSFENILEICLEENITNLKDLKEIGLCDKCCMCNPYIDEMMETTETKFERIL